MHLEEPDKLPWIEEVVDRKAVFLLMGKKPAGIVKSSHDVWTAEEKKEISAFLGRNNITFNAMPSNSAIKPWEQTACIITGTDTSDQKKISIN